LAYDDAEQEDAGDDCLFDLAVGVSDFFVDAIELADQKRFIVFEFFVDAADLASILD
jgi:hypothetical protein